MKKFSLLLVGCLVSFVAQGSMEPLIATAVPVEETADNSIVTSGQTVEKILHNLRTNSASVGASVMDDGNFKQQLTIVRSDGVNNRTYAVSKTLSANLFNNAPVCSVETLNNDYKLGIIDSHNFVNQRFSVKGAPVVIIEEDLSELISLVKKESSAESFIKGRQQGRLEGITTGSYLGITTGVVLGAATVGTAWYLSRKR